MEEQNPFPRRSCRLALKPPLPLEATSGRRRRHHSTETSTISTFGATSFSHIPELSQVVSRILVHILLSRWSPHNYPWPRSIQSVRPYLLNSTLFNHKFIQIPSCFRGKLLLLKLDIIPRTNEIGSIIPLYFSFYIP